MKPLKRTLIELLAIAVFFLCLSAAFMAVRTSGADPGEPTGAYCMGPAGVIFDITEADARDIGGGIWIQGDFLPTDDVSPCDLLPGGD